MLFVDVRRADLDFEYCKFFAPLKTSRLKILTLDVNTELNTIDKDDSGQGKSSLCSQLKTTEV